MRVLGIDPGLTRCGWGIVDGRPGARPTAVGVGVIRSSAELDLELRLLELHTQVTALPYRVVDGDDWWVSDVASPRYNQYAQCAPGTCDFSEPASENLAAAGAVYDYAVVIDYNRGGTPGAGSAFFLHVTNGAPTAGCVAIDRGSLVALMRWLDPGSRPLIAIGVG